MCYASVSAVFPSSLHGGLRTAVCCHCPVAQECSTMSCWLRRKDKNLKYIFYFQTTVKVKKNDEPMIKSGIVIKAEGYPNGLRHQLRW